MSRESNLEIEGGWSKAVYIQIETVRTPLNFEEMEVAGNFLSGIIFLQSSDSLRSIESVFE